MYEDDYGLFLLATVIEHSESETICDEVLADYQRSCPESFIFASMASFILPLDGKSMLDIACEAGRLNVVRKLLDAGAQFSFLRPADQNEAADTIRHNAFELALKNGHKAVCELLLSHFGPEQVIGLVPQLHTFLLAACKCLDDKNILFMLSYCSAIDVEDTKRLVEAACRRSTRVILQYLHDDWNLSNNGFWEEMECAINARSLDVVRYLLLKYQAGAIQRGGQRLYLLAQRATYSKNLNILAELVNYSPELNDMLVDSSSSRNFSTNVIYFLMNNAMQKSSFTFTDMLCGNVAPVAVELGATMSKRCKYEPSPALFELDIPHLFDIEHFDSRLRGGGSPWGKDWQQDATKRLSFQMLLESGLPINPIHLSVYLTGVHHHPTFVQLAAYSGTFLREESQFLALFACHLFDFLQEWKELHEKIVIDCSKSLACENIAEGLKAGSIAIVYMRNDWVVLQDKDSLCRYLQKMGMSTEFLAEF